MKKDMVTHASEYTKLQELVEEKEQVEAELEGKMDRWVYLSELKEEIDSNNN